MASIWHKLAAIGGATAVGLGAYGSHGLSHLQPTYREVFDTANKYHILHGGLLMAIVPFTRRPHIVGSLTLVGTLLFSGSCYTVALCQDRRYGKLTPFGGVALIAAWLALAL